MAATLIFRHEGWTVATAAWSAGSKDGKTVSVCYQWGANGISFFDSAVGNAKVEIAIPLHEFLALIRGGGEVDLTSFPST